jgi:hypothetical protein
LQHLDPYVYCWSQFQQNLVIIVRPRFFDAILLVPNLVTEIWFTPGSAASSASAVESIYESTPSPVYFVSSPTLIDDVPSSATRVTDIID